MTDLPGPYLRAAAARAHTDELIRQAKAIRLARDHVEDYASEHQAIRETADARRFACWSFLRLRLQ